MTLGIFLILWEDYLTIEQFGYRNSKKIQSPKMLILGEVEQIERKHCVEIGLLCGSALSILAQRHSGHSYHSK